MKIVADTMLWVSYCTLETGYQHGLLERARRRRVRFFVSEYILTELRETLIEALGRPRRHAALAVKRVRTLAKLVNLPKQIRAFVPDDPDDNPIVQTALTAKSDYLVTSDSAILKLGKIEDVEILSPRQFEERLASA